MKVGDKVVCIKTHSLQMVKKGNSYTVTGVYNDCNCGTTITVGVLLPNDYMNIKCRCAECGVLIQTDTEWSFDIILFREIQTNSISKQLAASFIEKDSKVREQEHEKVFDLNRQF